MVDTRSSREDAGAQRSQNAIPRVAQRTENDVSPRSRDLPTSVRRYRRATMAAVLAVVVVATGVALGDRPHRHVTASVPPSVNGTTSTANHPTMDVSAVDPAFRLGPDQVPSVAGLNPAQARSLLISRGYRVQVVERHDCPSAQNAPAVQPGPGSILAGGSTVTLRVTTPTPGALCPLGADVPDPRVTTFLAWARGFGPEPAFSPTVTVQVITRSTGEDLVTRLHGVAIADRANWPGLTALGDVLAVPVRGSVGLLPLAVTRTDSTCLPVLGGTCPEMPGASLGGGAAAATSRRSDTGGDFTIGLQLSADGTINAVALVDQRAPRDTDSPDVVGDSASYASVRLRAYGLHTRRRDVDDCAQREQVTHTETSGDQATISVSRGNDARAD